MKSIIKIQRGKYILVKRRYIVDSVIKYIFLKIRKIEKKYENIFNIIFYFNFNQYYN
jgi:hypothetical protein